MTKNPLKYLPRDIPNSIDNIMGKYILKYRNPYPYNNLIKWGKWYENINNRIVRRTYINDIFISTVFLGLDHGMDNGKPILFETMIFRNGEEQGCERCTTWREALAMHWKAVELVKKELKNVR